MWALQFVGRRATEQTEALRSPKYGAGCIDRETEVAMKPSDRCRIALVVALFVDKAVFTHSSLTSRRR